MARRRFAERVYREPQTPREIFEYGFDSEDRQIEAIKQYLLSDDDRALLREHDVSLSDILNGRFAVALNAEIFPMFKRWNEKLGYKRFMEQGIGAELLEAVTDEFAKHGITKVRYE